MRPIVLLLCLAALAPAAFAQAPAQVKKDQADLAKLSTQRDASKTAMYKHPGNASYRHAFVLINDRFANKTMNASWMTPHDKYSKALRLYRVSLNLDPHDPDAKQWVDMIESIYKSMGRPIPK